MPISPEANGAVRERGEVDLGHLGQRDPHAARLVEDRIGVVDRGPCLVTDGSVAALTSGSSRTVTDTSAPARIAAGEQ
ncbi:MAG: hypothetical protein H0T99_03800 [Geodermatophilaceae bacterium]|nr:hypothetical protein [Geodermatophilaceae bacterium]